MKPEPKNNLKSLAKLLLAGGLALLPLGLAYLFLSPKVYQSSAKVRVEKRGWIRTEKPGVRAAGSFEAPVIVAEYQFMRSDAFLSQVIGNLGLREVWSKRSPQGGTALSTNDALMRLRTQTRIQLVPNTSIIEAQVTGADAAETARIANEIVRRYHDYRQAQRQNASGEMITSLQTRWEEQGKKVSAARERLAQVVLDIKKARAANTNTFYDPASFEAMQTRRVELETDYVRQQSALEELKMLKPEQLRRVLPGMVSNSTLTAALDQFQTAERDLAEAKTTRGPDTPEVKHAAIMVQALDKNVTQVMAGVMIEREADLASRKSLLEKLNQELKHASTNVDQFSPNNPAYVAALQNVQKLEEERDLLKTKLDTDSLEAVSPFSLSAEIMQTAETPVRPASPDGNLALGIMGAGGAAAIGGLLLVLLINRKPKPAHGNAQVPRPAV
jgi:uncharacterized protein involved in exopolysaccharide biosynthesis